MEVGAVKQAFNNEIILLKKNLNQAKTQTIHKLTRKAKTLADKKAPESIKEKFNKKAESAVKEVLIIKKIKPKHIAEFIVTHKGKLNDFMNKPVNNDKACARLLLHKSMEQKYKLIREKFSNISIKDLFMSRQERLKLKKEARDKQKNKKKGKDKTVNVEGDWDVVMTEANKKTNDIMNSNDLANNENDKSAFDSDDKINLDSGNDLNNDSDESDEEIDDDEEIEQSNSEETDIPSEEEKSVKVSSSKAVELTKGSNIKISAQVKGKRSDKKPKENKNRNLKEKLEKRNFNKDPDDSPLIASKIADPFFITSSGQNYMSLVEPRQPDEVKEVHRQGNRQYRRSVMFGHAPKARPRRNYDQQTNYIKNNQSVPKEEVPEKLHPSWEAKKKQSSILPFQGKKIVFNES